MSSRKTPRENTAAAPKITLFMATGILWAIAGAPAIAEPRLIESLTDGLKIVEDCAKDVATICANVMPGEGRIKACLKEKVAKLSPNCVNAILGAAIDKNDGKVTIPLNPGVTPGLEVHTEKARDYAYCEIAPIVRREGKIEAQFYNTTGTVGATGGCPPEPFAVIDEKKLSEKLGAALTYMNPTPQTSRRHWVMDQNWVYVVGETVNFDGVAATWMASMSTADLLAALNSGPYTPVEIHRKSKYLYATGSTVFVMRPTDKKIAYVMQSYASEVDPKLSFDQLPQLGPRLKLPEGWTFEAKVLDRDLTVDPRNAEGVAHIIRDDLHDVYEGCGFDAACDFVP